MTQQLARAIFAEAMCLSVVVLFNSEQWCVGGAIATDYDAKVRALSNHWSRWTVCITVTSYGDVVIVECVCCAVVVSQGTDRELGGGGGELPNRTG